jgi:hypothetical protein
LTLNFDRRYAEHAHPSKTLPFSRKGAQLCLIGKILGSSYTKRQSLKRTMTN